MRSFFNCKCTSGERVSAVAQQTPRVHAHIHFISSAGTTGYTCCCCVEFWIVMHGRSRTKYVHCKHSQQPSAQIGASLSHRGSLSPSSLERVLFHSVWHSSLAICTWLSANFAISAHCAHYIIPLNWEQSTHRHQQNQKLFPTAEKCRVWCAI